VNPSTIARHVANHEWPDIHQQKKIAPGVFWFISAGHGGCVAMLDIFDQASQDALRSHGKTTKVLITGKRCWSERRYSWAMPYADEGGTIVEVVIGEEDCDWACIFLAKPELIDDANEKLGGGAWTLDMVATTACRWNPAFAAELGYVKDPD
jgi:hypothetical protein